MIILDSLLTLTVTTGQDQRTKIDRPQLKLSIPIEIVFAVIAPKENFKIIRNVMHLKMSP